MGINRFTKFIVRRFNPYYTKSDDHTIITRRYTRFITEPFVMLKNLSQYEGRFRSLKHGFVRIILEQYCYHKKRKNSVIKMKS